MLDFGRVGGLFSLYALCDLVDLFCVGRELPCERASWLGLSSLCLVCRVNISARSWACVDEWVRCVYTWWGLRFVRDRWGCEDWIWVPVLASGYDVVLEGDFLEGLHCNLINITQTLPERNTKYKEINTKCKHDVRQMYLFGSCNN